MEITDVLNHHFPSFGIHTGLILFVMLSYRSSRLDLAIASVLHTLSFFVIFPISSMEYPVILDEGEMDEATQEPKHVMRKK